ncbi:hypothetical protein Sjap_020415 [Stephania japonica]|uniref:Uncharacterized protein n=1 Tax=Stephania japonica TaxID=461633 RepID=A0AAP0F0M8_9MAGN
MIVDGQPTVDEVPYYDVLLVGPLSCWTNFSQHLCVRVSRRYVIVIILSLLDYHHCLSDEHFRISSVYMLLISMSSSLACRCLTVAIVYRMNFSQQLPVCVLLFGSSSSSVLYHYSLGRSFSWCSLLVLPLHIHSFHDLVSNRKSVDIEEGKRSGAKACKGVREGFKGRERVKGGEGQIRG